MYIFLENAKNVGHVPFLLKSWGSFFRPVRSRDPIGIEGRRTQKNDIEIPRSEDAELGSHPFTYFT